jgi:hypothetical protein
MSAGAAPHSPRPVNGPSATVSRWLRAFFLPMA